MLKMCQLAYGLPLSLVRVSKKTITRFAGATITLQQQKQSSQGLLHAAEEEVGFAAFYSMETAFNQPEG